MTKRKRHKKGYHHHHQDCDDVMDVPGGSIGDPSSAGSSPNGESERERQTNRTGYNKVNQLRQVTELAENENEKQLDFTENYFTKCSHDGGEDLSVNGAAIPIPGI